MRTGPSTALPASLPCSCSRSCGDDDAGPGDTAATRIGCAARTTRPSAPADTAPATPVGEHVTLRLGYFPNVTHATALVGVEQGIFADALGDDVTLETSTFNAGGEAVEALFADAIDATYIGPNPAINGFAKSNGEALRIVSGATSGGAFLVVKPEITSPADLAGNDARHAGARQHPGRRAACLAAGERPVGRRVGWWRRLDQAAGERATLDAFKAGDIDGAWVPEPWATRLIQEGGGTVLVDERDLWPDGQYVTTHLIVATKFLDEHPDVVKRCCKVMWTATDFVNANPEESQTARQRRDRGDHPEADERRRARRRHGRTSRSPPTRSPARCRSRPTTRSRSACSTRSTSPASTRSTC